MSSKPQKVRFKGLAAFAVLMFLVNAGLHFSSRPSSSPLGVATIFWLLVAFEAFRGRPQIVAGYSVFFIILKALLFTYLAKNPPVSSFDARLAWIGEYLTDHSFSGAIILFLMDATPWLVTFIWALFCKRKIESFEDRSSSASNFQSDTLRQARQVYAQPEIASLSGKVADGKSSQAAPSGGSDFQRETSPATQSSNSIHQMASKVDADERATLLERGNVLLKYEDVVIELMDQASALPSSIKDDILIAFAYDPRVDFKVVFQSAILQALGRPDLAWSSDIESILRRLKSFSAGEVEEFIRVFPVLSQRMSIFEVFLKVAPKESVEMLVYNRGGRAVSVTRHGAMGFSVNLFGDRRDFLTLEEVYDYLDTPASRRQPQLKT